RSSASALSLKARAPWSRRCPPPTGWSPRAVSPPPPGSARRVRPMADDVRLAALRRQFESTAGRLRQQLGPDAFTTSEFRDNFRVHVAPERLLAVLGFLKDPCGFDMLVELSAADYLHYPGAKDRYGVWYVLLNTATG